jgi:hypothetical protein
MDGNQLRVRLIDAPGMAKRAIVAPPAPRPSGLTRSGVETQVNLAWSSVCHAGGFLMHPQGLQLIIRQKLADGVGPAPVADPSAPGSWHHWRR